MLTRRQRRALDWEAMPPKQDAKWAYAQAITAKHRWPKVGWSEVSHVDQAREYHGRLIHDMDDPHRLRDARRERRAIAKAARKR